MLALPTFWLIVLTYWPPGISDLRPARLDSPSPLEFSSNGTFKLVHTFQLAHHETLVRFLIAVDVTRHIHDFGSSDEAGFEILRILMVHKYCLSRRYLSKRKLLILAYSLVGDFFFCQFHFDVVIEFIL